MVYIQFQQMNASQLPKLIAEVVNGTTPIETIGEELETFLESRNINIIAQVFSEISKGCNSKSSWVVDNATKVIQQIIHTENQLIVSQFNSEEFQKALMYTLRGKTTKFGNKFSMHRQAWRTIQDRVLGFYAKWFHQYMLQQSKVSKIMKNYRTLKSYNLKFPEQSIMHTNDTVSSPKQIQIQVSENKFSLEVEKESLEVFLDGYGKMIEGGIDEQIAQQVQFKIKEKLIYALNNVLLYESPKVRLKAAMDYNKRFNHLIQKLKKSKKQISNPEKQKGILRSNGTTKSQIKQQVKYPLKSKTSGIRSLIKSTIAYISSQPADIKDKQTKQKVITKLDQTIGDLVKYFDNQEQMEQIDVSNVPQTTKSNLY